MHLPDPGNHFVQLLAGFAQDRQVASLDTPDDLARELPGLPRNPAGDFQQFDVRVLRLLRPCSVLLRLARAIAKTFSFADRLRSRIYVPAFPATAVTLFMMRVRTRTPSPSNVLSVG